jgi:surface antigen
MLLQLLAVKEINKPPEIPQPKPVQTVQVEPKKKKIIKPQKYRIRQNDTLIKIAKKHKTTWQRIYYKNKSIKNPDQLKVGVVIYLPSKHEKLKKRTFYHPEPKEAVETIKNGSGEAVAGNMYANDMTPGYCTFWAKSQRPDLPTGLGNANTWYARASTWGLPVGSTPRVGAVATTTRGAEGHVSIVEKVKGNQIYVSEMNVQGWNVLSYAWYPASDYLYIY